MNSNQKKLSDLPTQVKLFRDTEIMIAALASKRGESKAEVIRRLLHRTAAEELLNEFGTDTLLTLVRKAMSDTQKPMEERLAALNAKTAIAAATAMYTNIETLGQMGKRDIRNIHEEARKKAVAYIRSKSEKTLSEDDRNE